MNRAYYIHEKILFATTNNNKVSRIRNLLQDTPIKLLSLSDIDTTLAEPNENLNSCISIAAQKTLDYLDQIDKRFYVLTQDDTLQVLDVSPEDNPGASIKEPVVNTYGEFNDENAI